MLNAKKIAYNKLLAALVLITQVLFPFYNSFAATSTRSCSQFEKPVNKHCCCCDENSSGKKCSCVDDDTVAPAAALSFSRCDCVFKPLNSKSEVTTQQSYELNKIVAVEFVDFNSPISYSNTIIYKIHSLKSLNGPPIYLSDSTFLI